MSLYQTVKSAITVRQVGEMYGMAPDRHGMVCCPFHSDSDPSMKLNDTYYYCFGCRANGDAIDLTAKLFDLNPRQAAEKLASDFGLDPDKPPANAIALPPPKRGLTDEQWADIAYCLRVLTDYLDLLHDWRERYKPASPDRWLTFLHELLDDADIPTLQEYLGYCLIPSTKGQKMMLIVGKGGEGKSRIGLVLKRLMGDAASNGSVQKVENNRFARADLERRLLMIDDDMDMNALPKTNYIKTIVTAEAKLDLERKGVQSYQRDIYARFLCFGNGALTSLYDHSDGFFRRQLILTTKDKPTDRTDDPFLVEKMCAELEGILLWCLEGLHRLVQNDFRFTVSERAAANVDTIKRSSNNVIDFMESEGYFRFKADYSISSKEFYDIYKQWCEDNACHSVSAIRFSAELRQNDRRYNLEATNNIYLPGGRRVRGFVGIEPLVHPCP